MLIDQISDREMIQREYIILPKVRTERRTKTPAAFMADAELIIVFDFSQSLIMWWICFQALF